MIEKPSGGPQQDTTNSSGPVLSTMEVLSCKHYITPTTQLYVTVGFRNHLTL